MLLPERMPEHWNAFFTELDSKLTEEVHLHCLGGFVISVCYGLERPTNDVDFISLHPNDQREVILTLAGEGSSLWRKHGVYLQCVTVFEFARRLRRASDRDVPRYISKHPPLCVG